jgi:hypothetical protein
MGRIRISGKRDAAGRLVGVEFRQGTGAFTLPVRDENEGDEQNEPRLVRCSVCGVPMPEPPNPDGRGICLFDTCKACLEDRRR